jgi:RNA polymerase sigma factor (TIGR02999 family)
LVTEPSPRLTQLLVDWSNGDEEALTKLLPLVYGELRRRAEWQLRRERIGHTLQTTALIHEAYVRLVDQRSVRWQNRTHFFAVAAQLMRRILVDHARGRRRAKRGGSAARVPLEEALLVAAGQLNVDVLALDEALTRLTAVQPRQSQVVELRFFSGLSIEETASVLGVSAATVKSDWNIAKAWLRREMVGSGAQ